MEQEGGEDDTEDTAGRRREVEVCGSESSTAVSDSTVRFKRGKGIAGITDFSPEEEEIKSEGGRGGAAYSSS